MQSTAASMARTTTRPDKASPASPKGKIDIKAQALAPDLEAIRRFIVQMVARGAIAEMIASVLALLQRMRELNTELMMRMAAASRKRPPSETLHRLQLELPLSFDPRLERGCAHRSLRARRRAHQGARLGVVLHRPRRDQHEGCSMSPTARCPHGRALAHRGGPPVRVLRLRADSGGRGTSTIFFAAARSPASCATAPRPTTASSAPVASVAAATPTRGAGWSKRFAAATAER